MATTSIGHEVRPAVLRIVERSNGHVDVSWRQPSGGGMALRLEPHVSGGMLARPPSVSDSFPDSLTREWRDLDLGAGGLDGHTVEVAGLDHTLIEAWVLVQRADGSSVRAVLDAHTPAVTLHLDSRPGGILDYLVLGMRHILTGPDHLLFVLALILITPSVPSLLGTITAFTAAHSMTLAAGVLGLVQVSPALIDYLIALSILFVALEVVKPGKAKSSAAARQLWLLAFCFGLLHGLGFATGLSAAGLTHPELLEALLLFNGGVELGQLAFIAVVLIARRLLQSVPIEWPRPTRLLPGYAIGSMAIFWMIENSLQLFADH